MGFFERSLSPILTVVLAVQVVGAFNAARMEYRHVFSYGKEVATYIEKHALENLLIVGGRDYSASTVVGYLGMDRIYYPTGDRFGSFIRWDAARKADKISGTYYSTLERRREVLARARRLQADRKRDLLIIASYDFAEDLVAEYSITQLAEFSPATLSDEEFSLYRMPWRGDPPSEHGSGPPSAEQNSPLGHERAPPGTIGR